MWRLLVLAGLLYLGYRLFAALGGGGGGGSDFKCATCRFCGRLDEDGVICRFGDKQTFKTPVHIANCIDYQKRS